MEVVRALASSRDVAFQDLATAPRFNDSVEAWSHIVAKGELLSASLLEPEWTQFAYMYFELFESIFASYVDFPVIRVKSS